MDDDGGWHRPNHMIDDVRYLAIFAKVVEKGSLTAAAEALGLSIATVSTHLAKLEASLNVPLLYRNTRKLALTADGLQAYETAKAMVALYEQGLSGLKQKSAGMRHALRVAVPSALLAYQPFMEAISAFAIANGDAALQLHCSDLREDVVGDGFDVALRIGDLPDSGLKARAIFDFERVVVAHRRLFTSRGLPVHPRELADYPWIGLSMLPYQRSFRHASGERHTVKYTPVAVVDSVEAAFQLAATGLGIAVPPAFRLEQVLQQTGLVRLVPDWSIAPLTVYAVWPANLSRSSIPYRFIEFLAARFAHP